MGNIITTADNNSKAFTIDAVGNVTNVKDTTFNGVSTFNNDVTIGSSEVPRILYVNGVQVNTNALNALSGNFSGNVIQATSGLTGTTGTFSGLLTANGGLTGTTGNFTQLLTANGGLTGTTGNFSQLLTTNGLSGTTGTFSGLLTANGGLTGTTGNFTRLLITNGLSGTTGTFTGVLTASGGINGNLTGNVSGNLQGTTVKATNIQGDNFTGGTISGTTGNFSDGLTATTGTFSGLLTANGGINGNLTGDVSGNLEGTTVKATNIQADNFTGGTISGTTGNFSDGLSSTTGQFSDFGSFQNNVTINQGNSPWDGKSNLSRANGIVINGTNKWTIGEVTKRSGTRLCFSKGDMPFACIDPSTLNLTSALDPNWT